MGGLHRHWAMNDQAKIDEVKSLAEELRLEAKAGKVTRSRLNALKPFIAVVRELVDILGRCWNLPPTLTTRARRRPATSARNPAPEEAEAGFQEGQTVRHHF